MTVAAVLWLCCWVFGPGLGLLLAAVGLVTGIVAAAIAAGGRR